MSQTRQHLVPCVCVIINFGVREFRNRLRKVLYTFVVKPIHLNEGIVAFAFRGGKVPPDSSLSLHNTHTR
jgi:hypothetical protein